MMVSYNRGTLKKVIQSSWMTIFVRTCHVHGGQGQGAQGAPAVSKDASMMRTTYKLILKTIWVTSFYKVNIYDQII